MKLLTKKLEKRFAQVGRQEQVYDPMVIAKFFDPVPKEVETYYAITYDPGKRVFYGYYCCPSGNPGDYWGNFSLDKPPTDSFERDLDFQEQPASQAIHPDLEGWWDLEIMLSSWSIRQ